MTHECLIHARASRQLMRLAGRDEGHSGGEGLPQGGHGVTAARPVRNSLLGVKLDLRGNVHAGENTTSVPGVFAARGID